MNKGDLIYCVDETNYSEHISKRRSYVIIDIKDDKFRIKSNKGKLAWIPSICFVKNVIPSITLIRIDDENFSPQKDIVEVSIFFDNGEKRWINFAAVGWLKNRVTTKEDFLTGAGIVFIKELTKESIESAVIQIDKSNELIDSTKLY